MPRSSAPQSWWCFWGSSWGRCCCPCWMWAAEMAGPVVILILYALVLLAVIVGVVIALIQRLREIERGEEEDARKY